MDTERVIILGAAGRDFHDFMTYWSRKPNAQVVCFTGTQIPGIDGRDFPAELCRNEINDNVYPNGLKIFPESSLEELIERFDADTCALAYSDLNYNTVQSLASRVNAAGCKFVQLPPSYTQLESNKPVIAVCASRTGVGKSQTTRYVAKYFKDKGRKVAVVRHPMPYDQNLLAQRFQKYETMEDMDKYKCTIEEREEYFKHIEEGTLLFAGVDYDMILHEAEKLADVIIWDGGNNDTPFFKPDLMITLVDSLRPTDEVHYFPGETNVRMADVAIIAKVSSVLDALDHADLLKTLVKPGCPVVYASSEITPAMPGMSQDEAKALIKGKRVLVVDDGPTLTHGGVPYGAGFLLANRLDASEIVDPRPYAQGSLKTVFEKFPHLDKVLPAMGYGDEQVKELEDTINAVDCDVVICGTPSDLGNVIKVNKPTIMANYCLEVFPEHIKEFHHALDKVFEKYDANHMHDSYTGLVVEKEYGKTASL
jgi:predicted GTPase